MLPLALVRKVAIRHPRPRKASSILAGFAHLSHRQPRYLCWLLLICALYSSTFAGEDKRYKEEINSIIIYFLSKRIIILFISSLYLLSSPARSARKVRLSWSSTFPIRTTIL